MDLSTPGNFLIQEPIKSGSLTGIFNAMYQALTSDYTVLHRSTHSIWRWGLSNFSEPLTITANQRKTVSLLWVLTAFEV